MLKGDRPRTQTDFAEVVQVKGDFILHCYKMTKSQKAAFADAGRRSRETACLLTCIFGDAGLFSQEIMRLKHIIILQNKAPAALLQNGAV